MRVSGGARRAGYMIPAGRAFLLGVAARKSGRPAVRRAGAGRRTAVRRARPQVPPSSLASERLRVALLHSPAVVFAQDRRLRFTWLHNSSPPWSETELVGKTDADVFPAEEARHLTAIKRTVLETGRGAREVLAVTLAGERRWFDLTVEPVTDVAGRITGVTCATWDVTDQTRAQDEARRLAVLEERNRLAREMHDSLAQGLVGVILKLEAAEEAVAADPAQALPVVRTVREMARGVLDEARRSLQALRPRLLDHADLAAALERLGGEVGSQTRAAVRVSVRGRPRPLGRDVEENLLRLAQEALQNAVRHAQARRIQVELAFDGRGARLQVEDDGRGFDLARRSPGGLGLDIMRERAERVGGLLEVETAPGRGTRVRVRAGAPSGGAA